MALLAAAAYLVFGVGFAVLAGSSTSNATRVTWNRLGFVFSALVFALHIAYEHFRLRSSPLRTACHVSIAVALGAFALAAKANLRGYTTGSGNPRLLALALFAWPFITGVPAFVVALVTVAFLRLKNASDKAVNTTDKHE